MADLENSHSKQLSQDESTSCSNSELEYDSLEPETMSSSSTCHQNNNIYNNNKNHVSNSMNSSASSPSNSSSSRRNKRKNFKPRNIQEYADSEEENEPGPESLHMNSSTNSIGSSHLSRRLLGGFNSHIIQQPSRVGYKTSKGKGNNDEDNEENELSRNNDSSDSENGDIPLDLSEAQNETTRRPKDNSRFLNSSAHHHHHLPSSASLEPQFHLDSAAQLQANLLHSFPHFTPMDLRLLANSSSIERNPSASSNLEFNVNSTSYLNSLNKNSYVIPHDMFSAEHINNNNSNTNNNGNLNGNYSSSSSSALSDFAQSTMKELLGLYGIAKNLRQVGGSGSGGGVGKMSSMDIPNNYDLHHLESRLGKLDSSKMMFPENMAGFLAAMNDSMYQNPLFQNLNGSSHIERSNHRHQSPPSFGKQSSIPDSISKISTTNGIDAASLNDLKSNNTNANNSSPNNTANTTSSNNSNSGQAESIKNSDNTNSLLRNTRSKTKGKSADFDLSSFPVIREGLLGKGTGPVDYTRYVKRFDSFTDCGYQNCRELNYKEHFHCLQCGDGTRVFVKKDEMIRHFKWHKKRDESLQHGFMRYSSSDNCSDRFTECPHNRKQTHYHCIHDGCKKVYVSTSDVQMHSNYHRKDSAIIQEGFQRFRAMEDCHAEHCGFRHQQTTHFHCRRESCLYTFKNKADMEKHKAYHAKGEQMSRDGFKKFMKHEDCNFASCRFSRVCNHIHCIREGCKYVLHSSGQLYSHKRKHERRDSEIAYRRFKLAQSIMRGTILGADLSNASWNESLPIKSDDEQSHSSSIGIDERDDKSGKIEQCSCDDLEIEHFHCRADCCDNAIFPNVETASEHNRNHEIQDRISSLAYFTVDPTNFDAQDATIPCVSAKCPYQNTEKHYHCLWSECPEIILPGDAPFKRLEHFKAHETTQKLELLPDRDDNSSLDGFFKKKRGRPLKNRTIEVPGPNESIFTSFKLPKPRLPGTSPENEHSSSDTEFKDPIGFTSYHAKSMCPDPLCAFNNSSCSHYHCAHPRCHFAVKDVNKLSCHLRDFHSNIDILDGYEYYDQSSSCHKVNCEFNEKTNHFHCTRDGYVFERYFSMAIHDADCHAESKSNIGSSDDDEQELQVPTVALKHEQFLKKHDNLLFQSKVNEKTTNGVHAMDLSSAVTTNETESKELRNRSDHSLSKILDLPEETELTTAFGPDFACGRPFCKLKRKNHFHCDLCNQAFSEVDKLRAHALKHKNLTSSSEMPTAHDRHDSSDQTDSSGRKSNTDDKTLSSNYPVTSTPSQLDLSSSQPIPSAIPPNFLNYPMASPHSPYLFLQHHPFSSLYAGMMYGQNYTGVSPTPQNQHDMISQLAALSSMPKPSLGSTPTDLRDTMSPSNNNNVPSPVTPLKRPPSNTSSPSSPPDKKQRMQLRILKDEPVPEGYVRFRFNEDCNYEHCGYREHQTHFHCIREDCGYSFCDKTRFVQHTARHDRLDSLMGGDFKQYRANMACGRKDCSYLPASGTNVQGQPNKASHFHCCKCDYVCTDTNKVVAHRRQHQKMESISAAGFEKFTPSQLCNDESCVHIQKQTHYHCMQCNFSVLGLSQMSAHKYRHDEEMNKS